MSAIRETLFDMLFNASVQIAFFAILAAVFSPFVAKAKAKHQHLFYLGVLMVCMTVPVVNTLGGVRRSVITQISSQDALVGAHGAGRGFWILQEHAAGGRQIELSVGVEGVLVELWGIVTLYQLLRFGLGVWRVYRLRRDAKLLSSAEIGLAASVFAPQKIALLKSENINEPVTIGAIHPAIVLPSRLIALLDESEISAVFAHEYAHICRRDFLVHLPCEVLCLFMAWHPGVRYLRSKISQTREMACDEYAAVQLGKRSSYARTLLRLASLCLDASRRSAVGLGIFDGDNLEDRIMMLTKKRSPLSRAGLAGLVLAVGVSFGSGAVLARAASLQAKTDASSSTQAFAGTWHWMFQGKSFSTLILTPDGAGFKGSNTESRIALDDEGYLSKADATEGVPPTQIASTAKEGKALHVTMKDGFEFLVTLKDANHAEIRPIGAPANMKPIQAEKAQ